MPTIRISRKNPAKLKLRAIISKRAPSPVEPLAFTLAGPPPPLFVNYKCLEEFSDPWRGPSELAELSKTRFVAGQGSSGVGRSISHWRPGTSIFAGAPSTTMGSPRRSSPRAVSSKLGTLGNRRFVDEGARLTYDQETFLKFYNLKKEKNSGAAHGRQDGRSVYVTHFDDDEGRWCPASREGATLTELDGRAFLVGGMSNDVVAHVAIFSCSEAESSRWELLPGTREKIGRYGHVAGAYRENIVVFGGQQGCSKEGRRLLLNDVSLFNTVCGEWEELRMQGLLVRGRWGHCGAVVG